CIASTILPAMGAVKVAGVSFSDVQALHRKVTQRGATYQANRLVALLSKLFNLSIQWGMRSDNPATGIQRNQEVKRSRYLSPAELERLSAAMASYHDVDGANAIRLLLLTGARRGEVMAASWDQFDLQAGVWTKPSHLTKQRAEHRVPL